MTCVLVTGGSGRLGRAVLDRLAAAGHEVRAASRTGRPGGEGVRWVVADLATGEGVARAVAGADVVLHLASAPYRGRYTDRVEVGGTAALLGAAREAGVGHLVYTSIVGADRVPWGYFGTKVRAERLVRAGGVPWTILRATQFHAFVNQAFTAMARLGALVADPGVRAQPVDVRDVAARLVTLVERGPGGRVEEIGGPQVLSMAEAATQWLRARDSRRPVLRVRVPGGPGRAFRAGHLTTSEGATGMIRWADYLAGQ